MVAVACEHQMIHVVCMACGVDMLLCNDTAKSY